MKPGDDPEDFLLASEYAIEKSLLPKEQWATLLAPLLSGEAQDIFMLCLAVTLRIILI